MQASQVEAERQEMRESLIQKQNIIKTLERRISNLEMDVQEVQAKVRSGGSPSLAIDAAVTCCTG